MNDIDDDDSDRRADDDIDQGPCDVRCVVAVAWLPPPLPVSPARPCLSDERSTCESGLDSPAA
jgi:hypothetical protein